jgi:hypothetical protein
MKAFCIALFFFLLPTLAKAELSFINKSHDIFLPLKLQKQVGDYQAFPLFWWNFLIREVHTEQDWIDSERTCEKLKADTSGSILTINCQETLHEFIPYIRDWAQDLPLRGIRPTNSEFQSKLDSALAQASLPTGDRSLLEILRMDPLESWKELKKKTESKIKINLPRERGFFYDIRTHQIIIPIQFSFSPNETLKTSNFKTTLLDESWVFIGPHASNLQNEEQIKKDVRWVSKIGTLLLLIFGLALFCLKRRSVIILIPPVALAMFLSTIITILVFGSIHGLTISFGTAIVGLALDYGLQAVFNGESPHMWRSNFYGLITTLVGLFILMFSSIPLLKQMMFFSLIGLIFTFGLFFILFKKWPKLFRAKTLGINPKPKVAKTTLALCLILVSFSSFFILKPTLDLSRFDYQSPRARSASLWIFEMLKLQPPLFSVNGNENILSQTHREQFYAINHGVGLENLATYVPTLEKQNENLQSWKSPQCQKFEDHLNPTEKVFFKPFLEFKLCDKKLLHFLESDTKRRTYLKHIRAKDHWLSLWLPKTSEEERDLRKTFPQIVSLKEIATDIPMTLTHELQWMAPLSILCAGLLLFFYYQNFLFTALSLVPFFTGMGFVSFVSYVFHLEVSFVTIIALVMVFGFSIDYGIFATDLHRNLGDQSSQGVWTGLTLAMVTTCAGFIPLLFCAHPILLGLGQTLFCGAIGTYIGAVWGIPGLYELYSKRKFF